MSKFTYRRKIFKNYLLNAFESRPQFYSLLRIRCYDRHAGALCDDLKRLCSGSLRHRHSKSSAKWFRQCVGQLQRKLCSVVIFCRFCPYNLHVAWNQLLGHVQIHSFLATARPGCIIILHWFTLVCTSCWVGVGDINRSVERYDLLEISVSIRRAAPSLTISEGKLDYCRSR